MRQRHPDARQLLQFPCDHVFKAFGSNEAGTRFRDEVLTAISTIVSTPLDAGKSRPSSKGTYLCVSVLVRLQNFDQLREIYTALRRVRGLKYLL